VKQNQVLVAPAGLAGSAQESRFMFPGPVPAINLLGIKLVGFQHELREQFFLFGLGHVVFLVGRYLAGVHLLPNSDLFPVLLVFLLAAFLADVVPFIFGTTIDGKLFQFLRPVASGADFFHRWYSLP
jgi:membrane protein DedA with SNARE-associated domain